MKEYLDDKYKNKIIKLQMLERGKNFEKNIYTRINRVNRDTDIRRNKKKSK